MKVVIFENPETTTSREQAHVYLKKHSAPNTFEFYDKLNIAANVAKEYHAGVRHFVLSVLSSEIIENSEIFALYPDAKFVSPSSTLPSLRGAYPNLFFTSASNDYVEYVARLSGSINRVLVYNHADNPYVADVIKIFRAANIPTFDVHDPAWTHFTTITLVSIERLIWTEVTEQLNPALEYSIYGLEFFPLESLVFPANVINIAVLSPVSSVTPQMNSYWNELNRYTNFTNAGAIPGVYPLLVNKDWDELVTLNLISAILQLNGVVQSRYIPLYGIEIVYNTKNRNIRRKTCPKTVWVVAKEFLDRYAEFNLRYIREINPNLKRVVVVRDAKDAKSAVQKYWCRGIRRFVLDVPTDYIKKVQRSCFEDTIFICTRSGDPTIRHPGSKFLFGICTDNTIIDTRFVAAKAVTLDHMICVLGHSNNMNIPEFRRQLRLKNMAYIDVDRVSEIPSTSRAIISIGDDSDYRKVYDYVVANISALADLDIFWKYGSYITEEQFNTLYTIGQRGDMVVLNATSCQPFLDSYYSVGSRPPFLVNSIPYLYLPDMIYQFIDDIPFLYNFGYVIDI